MNSTEGQFFFKAIFTGNAIFEFTERDSSEKIAEFEFYSKLFPHLNAVGKWKEDSTYSAEFISQNSIHLSIFNRTNQDSYYYTFSKEVHQLSALEKKIPMILTAGMVIVKLLISEFRKRKAAIQRQIQSEKETKEFEEKELKELDEDQKEFMKKMKDAVHKSNDMFEDDEEIKKLEKEIQEDDRKEDEEIKKLEKELEEEEQNDDEDIKLEEIDESD
ncbi:hypothetical protein GPJ56_003236 [Histomonas meleagridis]|uniref:uncharacterized protein n=1 Tax=Histomonas meleagridis TaxID=135588 RepID=UPI00355A66BA|nr:hypothetical protein GPJ56_003236 [Histomonas meleagridis]KAH0802402.1 hypothetical protein GO595_004780 [Histomonas meleagridis]